MDNEGIKQALLKLFPSKLDFTVTMTGKASSRVNGLYKPDTHEILLHNKNFKTENALMYTAIHEYTHHLVTEELAASGLPLKGKGKCHDTNFWSKMDGLVDEAVRQGVYVRKRSSRLAKLTEEARTLDREVAEMKRKLGEKLREIQSLSDEEGERFEDVLAHDLRIQPGTARKCVDASLASVPDKALGQDELELAAAAKGEKASAAAKALASGKSLRQAKAAMVAKKPREEGAFERLKKEESRIEKTMALLGQRLETVREALAAM